MLSCGSSPLTRGKPCRSGPPSRPAGLIPAHAGKTVVSAASASHSWAHPRSRGENSMRAWTCILRAGSSPLTRGKPHQAPGKPLGLRLIPAHAGKTARCPGSGPARWAHPRSRGENTAPDRPTRSWMGSSPLTRGKQRASHRDAPPIRLIPAHAGKTQGIPTP